MKQPEPILMQPNTKNLLHQKLSLDLENLTQPNKQKSTIMAKYEFIEETNLILGDTIYFTKKDGMCISGSMSFDKAEALEKFQIITTDKYKTEIILETIIKEQD